MPGVTQIRYREEQKLQKSISQV